MKALGRYGLLTQRRFEHSRERTKHHYRERQHFPTDAPAWENEQASFCHFVQTAHMARREAAIQRTLLTLER